MELWTEYEGLTIEGAFPLKKLLLPEGRSAFFSTSNGQGVPTVIRLIASHFDEEEILARWRGVEALGHPNVLKIEQFGQLLLDDTTVVYAVFEPVDANLAEVIAGQQLSVAEATQLGSSLASALAMLHMHGFVHEHVEPGNVFAVGEVVKLRGDCIRETPEGERGEDAKRQDVHDLAAVMLLALRQVETLDAASRMQPLPAPLDQVVRNGLNGTWGLGQILAALDAKAGVGGEAVGINGRPASAGTQLESDSLAPVGLAVSPVEASTRNGASSQDTSEGKPVAGKFVPPVPRPLFAVEGGEAQRLPWTKRRASLAMAVVSAILLVWLIWHGVHLRAAGPGASTGATGSAAVGAGTAVQVAAGQASQRPSVPHAAGPIPAAKPSASSRAGKKASPAYTSAATNGREGWRVVAFTYNRADQAQKKVESIRQKHASLHPEVFTLTGHAPYLVTVGGVMGRDQAFAFAQQARRQGLPQDTYAQNYGGKR